MPDIVVIGDINIDVNLNVPAYPLPGSETVATSIKMNTGGSAVNTAIALAQMDVPVGFIGRVGQDVLANQVLQDLKLSGVDCSYIQVDPKLSTGLIFITVTEDGERTMFGARGANAFTEASAVEPDYFAQCRWIHLSGYSFLSYHQYETIQVALDIAKNSPYTRVSLDVGTEPALRASARIMEILPRLDVIFPNETELMLLSQRSTLEESQDYLLQQGVRAIVTKQGPRGCSVAVGSKRVQLPVFWGLEIKDTTGAGDSFNAGVVLGRLVGLSWEASAALGNAFGALTSTVEGAGAHIINRNDVFRLVERHLFRDEWQPVQTALEELAAYFEGVL